MNLILAKLCGFMASVPMASSATENKYNLPDRWMWVYEVVDVIDQITWPLLIIIAAAGTIYAIVLGVQMARADSTEKRDEAKKRVINVLVGMAIAVGLILVLRLFMEYLPQWIGDAE